MTSGWKQRTMIVATMVVLLGIGGGLSSRFAATIAASETEVTKVPATTLAVMDIAYIFKTIGGAIVVVVAGLVRKKWRQDARRVTLDD